MGGEPVPDSDVQRLFQQAFAAHQRGQFVPAEQGYREALSGAPDMPEALHYLGMVLFQREQASEAVRLMARSIELCPEDAGYRLNYGSVLEAMGQLSDARHQYEMAVRIEPDAADARFNAGLLQLRQGALEDALRNFEAVLQLAPEDSEARVHLGRCLSALGLWPEARRTFERAIGDGTTIPGVFVGAGQACRELGDLDGAVDYYRRALQLREDDPALMNNLANILRQTGQRAEARELLRNARRLCPNDASIAVNAARAELDLGATRQAIVDLRDALNVTPEEPVVLDLLAEALARLGPNEITSTLAPDFERVWDRQDNDPQRCARALAALLEQSVFGEPFSSDAGALAGDVIERAGTSVLLRCLLQRGLNVHGGLEQKLTSLRRSLLECSDDEVLARADLVAAVGLQCFGNEYIWPVTEAECALLEWMTGRIQSPSEALSLDWCLLLRMAMYQPLFDAVVERWSTELPRNPPSVLAAELWTRTVSEPALERELSASIRSLGRLTDATSLRVRAQYEDNPYPRWVGAPVPAKLGLAESLRVQFPNLALRPGQNPFQSVLVAGCGTGFEPILLARGESSSRIDAVDLSLTSLAYAVRRANELDVDNIEFYQGDLLEVERLNKRYDLIVSTGVLHHMANPIQGWRALTEVLRPGGLMRVGLYSERARRSVVMMRERITQRGLQWQLSAMREVRQQILEAGPAEAIAELSFSDDLFATSAVRDLLFHACEHQFTPARLVGVLQHLALDFVGMEVGDVAVRRQFEAFCGQRCEDADLALWEAFEDRYPQSFTGMMQFWCQRRA